MSLLEKNIRREMRGDKKTAEQLEFKAGRNNKEYELKSIRDSAVDTRESEAGHLPGFYYLIF